MRKSIIIYAAALLTATTSCDDFLTEDLKGDYSSANVMTTETQAQEVVNGIYNAAAYSINLWKFGDIASDDAVKGGNPGDQADLGYIEDFTALADNGVLSDFWQNTYETIARANILIDGMSGKSFDKRDRFIGEAKFLRAYSYFQLVNIFGEVPLKLVPPTSGSSVLTGLSSVEEIYAQIERDLKDATSLPVSYSDVDAGRVTCGAAWALLAKAQLYQKKYSEALSSIEKVKETGVYHLDDFANLFKLGNGNSPEAIFAIRFLSDQNPGVGNSLNQWFAPQAENGYYFNNPTADWVNSFTEKQTDGSDDARIDLSIGRDGKDWFNGDVFDQSWSTTGYLVRKHNQPLDEVEKGRKGDGGLAYIYLRYADVLLMEAECQNELGNPGLAEAPLNEVRGRAGLAPVTGKLQSNMRDIIRLERRHELAFEFHRFFDLMRYGKAAAQAAYATKTGVNFQWSEPRFYFPLPQAETDANTAIK